MLLKEVSLILNLSKSSKDTSVKIIMLLLKKKGWPKSVAHFSRAV